MPRNHIKIDDISIGSDQTIMVSAGDQRYIISNIPTLFLEKLMSYGSTRQIIGSVECKQIESIIPYSSNIIKLNKKEKMIMKLDCHLTHKICSKFKILSYEYTISLLLLLNISLIIFSKSWYSQICYSISKTTVIDGIVACLLYLASAFIHEFGHSAMCLKVTGLVGAITVQLRHGLPVFRSDVSSLHLAQSFDRAKIAAMGPIVQLCFGMMLLNTSLPPAPLAGALACLSALWSLVPFPGSDGFWLISDRSGCDLAARYRTMRWIEKIRHPYTCFLILSAIIIALTYIISITSIHKTSTSCLLLSIYGGIVIARYIIRFACFIFNGGTVQSRTDPSARELSIL